MLLEKRSGAFTVCVFAGTRPGDNPEFTAAARRFGRALSSDNYDLVFGGGTTGIMGAVAHEAIRHGVRVTSVIPRAMSDRNDTLDESQGADGVVLCGNMHQRKEYMYAAADGFVVFPGGIGTLDELIEVSTWRHLGLHDKPIILVNINGYWDFVLTALRSMEKAGFLSENIMGSIHLVDSSEAAIDSLQRYVQHPNAASAASGHVSEASNCLSTLNLARVVQLHAASEGFEWENHRRAYDKIKAELSGLENEVLKEEINLQRAAEELGDVLLAVINFIRFLNLDHEQILENAIQKFVIRYDKMKQLMSDALLDRQPTLDEMLRYWSMAKGEFR